MADYQFKYTPLTGRLTGNQMIEQTEQAINGLASLVDEAAGQVTIISTLANEANANAATALEVANEALATTGRTYITVSGQTDANIYYDSQLIYIADSTSTNIPVADTGMLEVKTNDNKTACEQVFIADSSGDAYYRNGVITAETVGDVTTYSVTWGGWSSQPASQVYVQQELTNYLPLSGGTVTGGLTVEGTITGNLAGNADTSTNATNDANGNPIASTYLPLAGGTLTGAVKFNPTGEVGYRATTHESTPSPCKQLIVSSTDIDHWSDEGGAKLSLHTYDTTGTNANEDGSFNFLATDGTNSRILSGKPDGDLTWNGKNLDHTVDLSVFKTAQQFTQPTIISNRIKDVGGGYKRVGNVVYVYMRFRLNTTLTKGGWGVAENFPAPYSMGFSADYRIPLIASAWYGDAYSGNVSSAFMDSSGIMRLITNGTLESTTTSNYYIYVYGNYYAE